MQIKDQTERLRRIKNLFVVRDKYRHLVTNKTIILIDDILTTSVTLNTVSQIFKQA